MCWLTIVAVISCTFIQVLCILYVQVIYTIQLFLYTAEIIEILKIASVR